jgi:hypothetical protein
MASDWGLFYTSHHYDSLLSNPWGFTRFGLAAARNAGTEWDWFKNREGILNFWRGGVLENRELDAYWPVGLRGTQDRAYNFPDGISEDEKNKAYREAIEEQVRMTRSLLPPGKTPLFHFTLYTEMLPQYLSGKLEVPPEVTIVWTDDNDGHMRALPPKKDQWKHGVYYHLAYFSTNTRLTKQITHTVTPARVEDEFRRIVQAGATEYMLVNVSELREYFGAAAADDVAASYRDYYRQLNSWEQISVGSNQVLAALTVLQSRFQNKPFTPNDSGVLTSLEQRDAAYQSAQKSIQTAMDHIAADKQQYFFEHVSFPLLVDWRQTTAAMKLIRAGVEPDAAMARKLCFSAFDDLKILEDEIRRAERPPFENWYRKTWIRSDDSPYNVHRSYERLRAFLIENYLKP